MPPIDNATILEPIKKFPLDFPVILAIFFFYTIHKACVNPIRNQVIDKITVGELKILIMKRLIFFVLLIGLICPTIVFAQNKALSLEGDEGYVSSNSTALNITGDLTVSARIKVNSFPNQWVPIVTNGTRIPSDRNYSIWLNRQNQSIHYSCGDIIDRLVLYR